MTVSAGIGIANFAFDDARRFWRWVAQCDEGGVDSIWQSDRIIGSDPSLECMSVMAALAGATRRIKFGMNVASLGLRDPVVTAKACATIDVLSEGRLLPALLARITDDVLGPWIAYQVGYFPSTPKISGVDATASPPIVNLPLLRDWVVPPILRLREQCGPRISVANWVGERYLEQPQDMLDLKLQVGPGSLLGQDPDVEALGPDFYKTYADRHDVPLILGVGAAFLAQARPAAVVDRVRQYAETGAQGGRFALYLCNLAANTPPENVAGGGWALFAILAFWQIPHFFAIAWIYREEYAKAGFQMLPNVDPDGRRTAMQSVSHALGLLTVSLCPFLFRLAGVWYLVGAIILGTVFLWCAIRFSSELSVSRARQLFFASIVYLPLLLILLVLDKVK